MPVEVQQTHSLGYAAVNLVSIAEPFVLGPLDSRVPPIIPVAAAFVYPPVDSAPASVSSPRLKRALELVLDYYPHLTGRLVARKDGTHQVERLGTGVHFLEARCDTRLDHRTTLDRLTLAHLPNQSNDLFAPFTPDPASVYAGPIVSVQQTTFACGGVSIGIRILHCVTDAAGFFQFARDLADIYRQLRGSSIAPRLAHAPTISGFLAQTSPADNARALGLKPAFFHLASDAKASAEQLEETRSKRPDSDPKPLPPTTGRFITFTGRSLRDLKSAAAADTSGRGWASTFEALAALLYRVLYRSRQQLRKDDPSLAPLSLPNLLVAADVRSRIPLPPRYFPNAILCAIMDLPDTSLSTAPLPSVAEAIHQRLMANDLQSPDVLLDTVKWLAAQPDKGEVRENLVVGSGCTMISSWSKLDLYSCALETRPLLVSTPFTPISLVDGLMYLLPNNKQGTPEDDGGVELCLALSDSLWTYFESDDEYRLYHTS